MQALNTLTRLALACALTSTLLAPASAIGNIPAAEHTVTGPATAFADTAIPLPPAQLNSLTRRYLSATDLAQRTDILSELADLATQAYPLPNGRDPGLILPDELIDAIAADVIPVLDQQNFNQIELHFQRLLPTLDASNRARLIPPLLAALHQVQTQSGRVMLPTVLMSSSRGQPALLLQAARESDDPSFLTLLAGAMRHDDLPEDLWQKLDDVNAGAQNLNDRLRMVQLLGPRANGYRSTLLVARKQVATASPGNDLITWVNILGGFPEPKEQIVPIMGRAYLRSVEAGREHSSAWAIANSLAYTGPQGLRYLAARAQSTSDAEERQDLTLTVLSAAAVTAPLATEDIAAVLDDMVALRRLDDTPEARQALPAVLLRSGNAGRDAITRALATEPNTALRTELERVLEEMQRRQQR